MVVSTTQGPLVVILGATGGQGGSVVTHLLASDRPYRLRGITRDSKQESSIKLLEQGLEVVEADTNSREDLKRAFEGAEIAFGVIDYWQFLDVDKSIANGKLIVDAVKEAEVKLLVWSGLESTQKAGEDEKERVGEWDAKANYARAEGAPLTVVESGCPMSNFASSMGPKLQPDGSIIFSLPIPSNTIISLLNTSRDFGAFARLAIESPEFGEGSNVLACVEELTLEELVQQWNEGKSL
ncbi:NmrA-domain-containing protein [Leucosporidium creatinivorum]|uniref:NmrA-domain-containing protein n=1 Tax=Leucosporidium creatinivorum TaxID=106004 RepID=A0A1Y2DG60_9BASI|nr:NmrA-domain-containing protein [Leucosporidium creatinivorum]